MQLIILGSSSKGNCYLLKSDSGETLMIECGIRFKKIQQALSFNYSSVVGCIMTHEHGDHMFCHKDILKAGIKIYTTKGTAGALSISGHHNVSCIEKKKSFIVGSFKVMAFHIEHDVAEPVGFMIYHPECGNTLFITDTCYVPYKFPDMNNIIVEANYCQDIIRNSHRSGMLNYTVMKRTERSHMHINTCRDFLLANDLTKVHNIVLIHLSDSNSNAMEFQRKITEATGKKVTIADAGIVVDNFNKTAF